METTSHRDPIYVHQLRRMWRFINTTALGAITAVNLAESMGMKNTAVDVFALGFVLTLSFPMTDGDSSVSFLVCIVEFIHVRHTDKGELKNVVTRFEHWVGDFVSLPLYRLIFCHTRQTTYPRDPRNKGCHPRTPET